MLPFAADMTAEDMKNAGGAENFRSLQGFYIYRNKRLIIWGTWFGMRLGELTKNARIRVDIPNSLDDIWGIDITKRTATIPKNILNQLRKTVKDAMDIATRKQTHRGRKENVDANISYIWNRMQGRNNNFYYELNVHNLLFKNVKDYIPADYHSYIDLMLDEIQLSIPIQQIYIDRCNEVIEIPERDDRLDDLYQQGITLVEAAMKFGKSKEEAIEYVMTSEPFCTKSELKGMLNTYCTEKYGK